MVYIECIVIVGFFILFLCLLFKNTRNSSCGSENFKQRALKENFDLNFDFDGKAAYIDKCVKANMEADRKHRPGPPRSPARLAHECTAEWIKNAKFNLKQHGQQCPGRSEMSFTFGANHKIVDDTTPSPTPTSPEQPIVNPTDATKVRIDDMKMAQVQPQATCKTGTPCGTDKHCHPEHPKAHPVTGCMNDSDTETPPAPAPEKPTVFLNKLSSELKGGLATIADNPRAIEASIVAAIETALAAAPASEHEGPLATVASNPSALVPALVPAVEAAVEAGVEAAIEAIPPYPTLEPPPQLMDSMLESIRKDTPCYKKIGTLCGTGIEPDVYKNRKNVINYNNQEDTYQFSIGNNGRLSIISS